MLLIACTAFHPLPLFIVNVIIIRWQLVRRKSRGIVQPHVAVIELPDHGRRWPSTLAGSWFGRRDAHFACQLKNTAGADSLGISRRAEMLANQMARLN